MKTRNRTKMRKESQKVMTLGIAVTRQFIRFPTCLGFTWKTLLFSADLGNSSRKALPIYVTTGEMSEKPPQVFRTTVETSEKALRVFTMTSETPEKALRVFTTTSQTSNRSFAFSECLRASGKALRVFTTTSETSKRSFSFSDCLPRRQGGHSGFSEPTRRPLDGEFPFWAPLGSRRRPYHSPPSKRDPTGRVNRAPSANRLGPD